MSVCVCVWVWRYLWSCLCIRMPQCVLNGFSFNWVRVCLIVCSRGPWRCVPFLTLKSERRVVSSRAKANANAERIAVKCSPLLRSPKPLNSTQLELFPLSLCSTQYHSFPLYSSSSCNFVECFRSNSCQGNLSSFIAFSFLRLSSVSRWVFSLHSKFLWKLLACVCLCTTLLGVLCLVLYHPFIALLLSFINTLLFLFLAVLLTTISSLVQNPLLLHFSCIFAPLVAKAVIAPSAGDLHCWTV